MSDEKSESRESEIYYRPEVGEAMRQDYERYDERWSGASQARDWAILIAIGFVQFLWMLIVYLYEPGIR
jgi:hypothetical protein